MALSVNNTLIAAQTQAYAAPSKARTPTAPAPGERGADAASFQAEDDAVRIELSAAAKEASERGRSREAEQNRAADEAADEAYAEEQAQARDYSREAPLKFAQENAGTRDVRPGSNLDIRI